MNLISNLTVPAIIAFVALWGIFKKSDIWNAMLRGMTDGAKTTFKILPSLIALLTAVYMLRASGAMDLITSLLSPIAKFLGIPSECVPLGILRPFSGSAALALGADVMKSSGADSFAGRVASVMLGSAETTFYTIAVYFGALKLNKTRYAIPAALIADIVGYIASVWAVKMFF